VSVAAFEVHSQLLYRAQRMRPVIKIMACYIDTHLPMKYEMEKTGLHPNRHVGPFQGTDVTYGNERFAASTATECNEVFSGHQTCEDGVVIQRFGDSLCLHHQG
jgi:hypothetical protein